MSCSPFDLQDYFLKELPPLEALQVEDHIHQCPGCREELDRLRLTEVALFSLRDQEIPQRIAFVSDKIFEPSWVRRWFSALWGSAGRLGFASAAMLSAALVFSSVNRPAPATGQDRVVIRPTVTTGPSAAEIQARIDAAVAKAVDQAVTQSEKTKQLLAALRREKEQAEAQLFRVAGDLEISKKRDRVHRAGLYTMPEPPAGDNK
jgi:anti-sigma factor RsiW